jgi:hypothetical protein
MSELSTDQLTQAYNAAVQRRMQLIEELYQLNCRFADVQREIAGYEIEMKKIKQNAR